MKKVQIIKGQILQHKGELNSKIFKVEQGLLRSYSIDEKGKEHIFMFASEGWIIADSISQAEPSDLFIDALEDSIVIQREKDIEIADVQKLIKRNRCASKESYHADECIGY